jgi:hypothetical protein
MFHCLFPPGVFFDNDLLLEGYVTLDEEGCACCVATLLVLIFVDSRF